MKLFISLSTILFSALSYYTVKVYFLRRKYSHLPGPRSKGLIDFYFGQYFTITRHMSNNILQELHLEWFRIYGPVFAYQVLNNMFVIINDESGVKAALIEEDFPKKGIGAFPFGERFLGFGLLTEVDKNKWRNRRALINHGFRKE